jgi:hypothetical protein
MYYHPPSCLTFKKLKVGEGGKEAGMYVGINVPAVDRVVKYHMLSLSLCGNVTSLQVSVCLYVWASTPKLEEDEILCIVQVLYCAVRADSKCLCGHCARCCRRNHGAS